MPNKMAKFCKEKVVFITVYVEKPRRTRVSANRHHHHHHHHYHHHHLLHANNQEVNRGSGKGYNRRAELLRYSKSLRTSTRSAAFSSSSSTLLLPKPTSPKNQPPTTNTVAIHRKPSHPRTPTCMGNWKILVPSFVWSLTSPKAKKARKTKKHDGSTTTKMKALMKSLGMQKKRFTIPKLFSAFRRHR